MCEHGYMTTHLSCSTGSAQQGWSCTQQLLATTAYILLHKLLLQCLLKLLTTNPHDITVRKQAKLLTVNKPCTPAADLMDLAA